MRAATARRVGERACVEDVACRVVTGNLAPDHSTIAEFRCRARRGAWMLAGLMLKTRGCEQQRGGPCRHAPAGVQGEATDAVLEGGAAPGRATRRWPRCGSRRPVPARHRRTAWRRRDAGARVSSRAAA